MSTTIKIFIPSITIASYVILLLMVMSSKPQNSFKRRFCLYLTSILFWSIAALIVLMDIGNMLFWFRAMASFALASMIALFYLTQLIINQEIRFSRLVYIYGFSAIFITQFTDIVISQASFVDGWLKYDFTPWSVLVIGPSYVIMIYCVSRLWQSVQLSKDENQITRISLFVAAILIILLGGFLNFTKLGQCPVDIAANVIAAFILAYAILRHQLFDVKVAFRKSLLYFIPTMVIGIIYFLFLTILLQIFNLNTNLEIFSTSLIISIIAALILEPFRGVVQNWIDRIFFRDRYNAVRMLQRVSEAATSVIDLDQLSQMILSEITQALHIQKAALFLRQSGRKNYSIASQVEMKLPPRTTIPSDHPLITWLSSHDHVVSQQDLDANPKFNSMWGQEKELVNVIDAELHIPFIAKGDLLGFLSLGPKLSGQMYSSEDKQTLLTLSHQVAVAVQNAQLYSTAHQELIQRRETEKRLQLQLKRLSALQDINMAITTNIDLQIPLYLLLEQVTDQLGVDAADVLLLDEESQQLNYVAGRGFQTDALKHTKLEVGQGLAGRAAEMMDVVYINNLMKEDTSLKQSPLLNEEGFTAYYGAPLISKGKVQGVLELFSHSPLSIDEDWENFLNTLTAETAIAVDNALLFRELEKSNMDLAVAYETTLEGWARTLELRDRETEGHSRRVLDLTMRLARKIGVPDEDMVHLQRGAVLHDIGKMGVPDSILLKEGPLTEEEWEVMHKHPTYAYEMLMSIPFLRKAVDIPYCHHEKWDGSGYPRGLKGEGIPLSARIFAIVDVWDALRSDRPYRKGWSDKKTLAHIQEQSGKHFDPMVVNAFMDIYNIESRKSRKK